MLTDAQGWMGYYLLGQRARSPYWVAVLFVLLLHTCFLVHRRSPIYARIVGELYSLASSGANNRFPADY